MRAVVAEEIFKVAEKGHSIRLRAGPNLSFFGGCAGNLSLSYSLILTLD